MTKMSRLIPQGLVVGLVGVALLSAPRGLTAQRTGVDIWSQNCGTCHLIQPAIRYTADQWETIMLNMAIHVRLTDAEEQAILEFLKGGAKRVASAERPRPPWRLLASALAMAAPAIEDDTAALYRGLCAACHGDGGEGDGPAAAALSPQPADFTDSTFQVSRSDDSLTTAIVEGVGTMPGFRAQLDDAQVKALVAYIRKLGGAVQG